VVVRAATAADCLAVTDLDAAITGMPKPGYWQEQFARLDQRREGERRVILVAIAPDQTFLGFAIGEIRAWEFGSPPCGWVFALEVVPGRREQGVAGALFKAICRHFRSAGVSRVRTMVARDAQELLSFFRSQGMMAGPFIELEQELDE